MHCGRQHHSSVISASKLKQEKMQPTVVRTEPETSDLADDVVVTFQSEESAKKDLNKKSKTRN